MGTGARDAVRGALDSRDPEVRFRARRVWDSLRWLTIAGVMAEDFPRLRTTIGDSAENRQAWDRAVAANGTRLLPFLGELWGDGEKENNDESESAEHSRAAVDGALLLLERVGAAELAGALAPQSDGLKPEAASGLVAAMVEAVSSGKRGAAACDRVGALCLHLWQYEGARVLALSGLDAGTPSAAVFYRTVVRRGNLRQKEVARLADDGISTCCARHMLRSVHLVAALEAPELLAGKELPKNKVKLQDMDKLALALAGMGLHDDAARLVADADSPGLLYVRSLLAAAAGDAEHAAADRAAALAALDKPPEKKPKEEPGRNGVRGGHPNENPLAGIAGLARMMDAHGDAAAAALWKRILDAKPAPIPGYAAEAWLRLGQAAEKRGEFARAVECYGKLLEAEARGGIRLSLVDRPGRDDKAKPAADWLKNRMAELRKKMK
jgi:tetratricopeptide (TPR) repeat protein